MPTESGHTTAIKASDVIDKGLCDSSGEEVGRVIDIVLDKTKDEILFAVATIGGSITTADNYYPIPWSILTFDPKNGCYGVEFTKEQLASGHSSSALSLTGNDAAKARKIANSYFEDLRKQP